MQLSDFQYDLPEELIAKYPEKERTGSRMLCVDRQSGKFIHRRFHEVEALLNPGDLLVCNNTKVIPARLFGQKASGGKIELLVERILDSHRILAHIRASKAPKPQSKLLFSNNIEFEVLGREQELYILKCLAEESVLDVIETLGELPLPPYFNRAPEESDKERYQTVFAEHKGSVAAPTAGLHFDEALLKRLQEKGVNIGYVTLHIGAGTFAPVRIDDIKQHRMHAEYIEVNEAVCEAVKSTKANGGRVIAVGTTAARSLETASLKGEIEPFSGDTNIFIYPGVAFHCIDGLITNLHLPGSTLLMLVSAFAGHTEMMRAYDVAVREKYRFFSYGDAMFIV